jgi:hypothetical protein
MVFIPTYFVPSNIGFGGDKALPFSTFLGMPIVFIVSCFGF